MVILFLFPVFLVSWTVYTEDFTGRAGPAARRYGFITRLYPNFGVRVAMFFHMWLPGNLAVSTG